MSATFIFLMIVIIITCLLLILIILSQNPKGGGLSSTFGGGGTQMFGVQRTTDFMDKATWSLASIIALLIICSAVIATPDKVFKTPTAAPETKKTEATNTGSTKKELQNNTAPKKENK